jgi:hypothetical protein
MLPIIIISIILNRENRIGYLFLLKLGYFSLVPVLPYIIIGKMYPNNPFGIDLSNWLQPSLAFRYLTLFLKQLSYPVYALAIISIIYIVVKKILFKPFVFVFFISFIFYYLFYTSITIHGQNPVQALNRYSLIFYPFISLLVGYLLLRFSELMNSKISYIFCFSILTIYLILISTIWQVPPLKEQFVTYKNINSRYFPGDKAMRWVKENIKEGDKILIVRLSSAMFYRDKYFIERDNIVVFWYDLDEISTPIRLVNFINTNKITHLIFTYSPPENVEIINYLKENRNNEFTGVTKFKMDKNYIFIYMVKDKLSFHDSYMKAV